MVLLRSSFPLVIARCQQRDVGVIECSPLSGIWKNVRDFPHV